MPPNPDAPARQRILEAAAELMTRVGLARATTKEIARLANCSEAALYKYFASKEEIFVIVLDELLPPLGPLLAGLALDRGERSVSEALEQVALTALSFYKATIPIASSLLGHPEVLKRHRAALAPLDAGPNRPIEVLGAYLQDERDAGRLRADACAEAAAAMLIGACYHRAFLQYFWSIDCGDEANRKFATELTATLLAGIAKEVDPQQP